MPWLLILFCYASVNAQNKDSTINIEQNYSELELPPLELLFENAYYSPAIEYYQIMKNQEISTLKTEKQSWLKYLRAEGFYRYGTIYTIQPVGSEISTVPLIENDPQSWYNLGMTMSIPLDDLFDRKKKTRRQELKVEAAFLQKEASFDQLKLEIIDLYTQAQKELNIVSAKAEELALANAQYRESEARFISGEANAEELSRRKSLQTNALQGYLDTKYSLYNILLKLEIITQTDIINK